MTFRVLTSFHYFRDRDMAELVDTLRQDYGGAVEMFADSGAFSAATLGVTISLADYRAWLTDWSGLITTAATLDVIGDPVATARNTEALEAAGLTVLPTFHVGTPWPVLEALCARHRYIALGGMVPHTKEPTAVLRWLIRCFRVAAETGTVFHGFGQTRLDTLAALPFYSVDSSTWASGARYGALTLWDETRARLVPVQAGNPQAAQRHADLLRSHGADPAAVGRPGFASLKHRSREQFEAELLMMRGVPAVAFTRLGQWLARRHRVPAPPGWHGAGTSLFLAETRRRHLRRGALGLAVSNGRPARLLDVEEAAR
ncbi:hypothetical protein ACFV27_00870 [Streptomyces antimycoticus]|uniref:hypothetical protein n=1 Tax=Streptomyces antimycoticus TaxID=68175 RepID=UPI00369B0AD6